MGVCVITVLSLPLFQLRLNHATQKQKQEREREKRRERAFVFSVCFCTCVCAFWGVVIANAKCRCRSLSLLRETTLSHRFFTLLAGFLFQFVGLKQFL